MTDLSTRIRSDIAVQLADVAINRMMRTHLRTWLAELDELPPSTDPLDLQIEARLRELRDGGEPAIEAALRSLDDR